MSTVAKPEAGPGCIPAPTSPWPGFLKEEAWASTKRIHLFWAVPWSWLIPSDQSSGAHLYWNIISIIILFNLFTLFYSTSSYLSYIVSSCPCMFEDLKPTEDSAFTRSVTLPRHAGPCRLSGCFARTLGWSQLTHSFGAFWAAVPQEITAKNQLSFYDQASRGKLARLVALYVMSDHFCARPVYMKNMQKLCVDCWPFYPWSLMPRTALAIAVKGNKQWRTRIFMAFIPMMRRLPLEKTFWEVICTFWRQSLSSEFMEPFGDLSLNLFVPKPAGAVCRLFSSLPL